MLANSVQTHFHLLVAGLAGQAFQLLLATGGAAVVQDLAGIEGQSVLDFLKGGDDSAGHINCKIGYLALVGCLAVDGHLRQAQLRGQTSLVVGRLRVVEHLLPAQGGVRLDQRVALSSA